jgi:hypothetical protein
MISPNPASSTRLKLWSALADVVTVLIFVAIGRRNHDGTVNAEGVFEVATPFLIALAIIWVVLIARRIPPLSVSAGVALWVGTVTVGMILRKAVFDGGTATAFVIVATIFLGLGLNGWRAVARWRTS